MLKSLQPVSAFGLEKLVNIDFQKITLSVIVSHNGLAFLYMIDGQGIAFEKFSINIDSFSETVKSSVSTDKQFKAIHLFFDNRFYIQIPSKKIAPTDADQVAVLLLGEEGLKPIFQQHKNFDVLFGMEEKMFSLVVKQWSGAVVHHYAEAFYQNTFSMASQEEEVFFDIRKNFFWAALFKNKKLQILNSYDFKGKADFGYFSMGIIKNKEFNPKTLKLNLSGNIQKDAPLEKLFTNYIEHIYTMDSEGIAKEFITFLHIIKYFK